ncbi:MAG: adenylyltransferase/cytidyltransferase family protein [Nanoarchaeota archaeon]
MKLVMCAGTFDIIHPGHLYFLSEAKKFGDKLIVVVARDDTSERMKGKKPVHNEKIRLEQVRGLEIVNQAVLGKTGSIFNIVEEIKPNIICLGYDQKVLKQDLEDELKKRNIKADVIRISSYMPHLYKSSKMKENNIK